MAAHKYDLDLNKDLPTQLKDNPEYVKLLQEPIVAQMVCDTIKAKNVKKMDRFMLIFF